MPLCVQVIQCDREAVAEHLADADVVVPLMTRLGAEQLALARRLKLIIQFGVGVEGIDIAAVRPGSGGGASGRQGPACRRR